jgi:dolichol-phosphate mannosyltransferase
LQDLASNYQAFPREVLVRLLDRPLLSKAHFCLTEERYLLRWEKVIEVPIHYRAPSPRVSRKAMLNSFAVLGHYTFLRLTGRAATL